MCSCPQDINFVFQMVSLIFSASVLFHQLHINAPPIKIPYKRKMFFGLNYFFPKWTVGTYSCIFHSSWGVSTFGAQCFYTSLISPLLRKSLRATLARDFLIFSFSDKIEEVFVIRVGDFLAELVMLCQTRLGYWACRELCFWNTFLFFFLPPRFVHWVFVFSWQNFWNLFLVILEKHCEALEGSSYHHNLTKMSEKETSDFVEGYDLSMSLVRSSSTINPNSPNA